MGDPLIQSGLITQMPWAGAVALGSEGDLDKSPGKAAAELCQLGHLNLETDKEIELLRFIP